MTPKNLTTRRSHLFGGRYPMERGHLENAAEMEEYDLLGQGHKRHCSPFVCARSVSGFISSKESQPLCFEDTWVALRAGPCGDGWRPPATGQHHLANSHVSESPLSRSSSPSQPSQAFRWDRSPANISTAPFWEFQSQNHLVLPCSDSWPTETVWDSVCCYPRPLGLG